MSNYFESPLFSSSGTFENTKLVNIHENSKIAKSSKKRPDDTSKTVEDLAKIVWQDAERNRLSTTNRLNRNVVYAQINALLVKEIHLAGQIFTRDVELGRGVQLNLNRGEFLFVMRTDGRIITISEEAEFHLGKSMRSLYAQCINIFDCLDESDGGKLKKIFESSQNDLGHEHQLVCSLRLPKGKRPSRVNEDVTTITMSGHFYSCHFPSTSFEKLFVVRCQSFVSGAASKSNSANASSLNNLEISLNDDMTISSVSQNVEEILGYRRSEIVNSWFPRFLVTEDFEKFESNRSRTYQHENQNESRIPKVIQDVCDIYTKNGESRLTFLYEIRAKRTRKTRPLKFDVTFRMIDPTLRDEVSQHLKSQNGEKKLDKVEEVNLEINAFSTAGKDSVLADSPSFARVLFDFDGFSKFQPEEIFPEFLSDNVAPVEFDQQLERKSFDDETFSIIDQFQNRFEQIFDQCAAERQINSYFENSLDLLAIEYGF